MQDLEAAAAAAAARLAASTCPVIAGLQTDVAGAAAAFRLARQLGACIDHAGAGALLRDQAVLQDAGMLTVSPGEARRRADTFLVVGEQPMALWPELAGIVSPAGAEEADPAVRRRVVALGATLPPHMDQRADVRVLSGEPAGICAFLGLLRARARGNPVAAQADAAAADAVVAELKSAAFGVAIWAPSELDALCIEMLVGLLKDLNAGTRWSGLSVAADATVSACAAVSGWVTALPLRTGFAGGVPQHDPWRFDVERLVEEGEADAVLWVSAFGDPLPPWIDRVPAVVVGDAVEAGTAGNAINIRVGRPGRDHDAILFDRRSGALAQVDATSARDVPSVADALDRILARLPQC